jgi:ABC-type transporter Mla MlaB component
MNIIVERKDSTKTVRVFGDINRHELLVLKAEFKELSALRSFILDLTEADFAGTDFVNLLAELRRVYSTIFSRVLIKNPNELIQDLLQISQLDKVVAISRVERAAVLV